MNYLICYNTSRPCQTPGMCSPHGGCRETEPVSSVWLEQLRSEFRSTVHERDQLKAELDEDKMHFRVMGQAIEGLIAERDQLRAENESMAGELNRLRAKHGDFSTGPSAEDAPYLFSIAPDRKGCTVDFNGTPHHYIEMSESYVACACGDEYRDDSYGAGFMAANNVVCENCDAAMGGLDMRKDAARYQWLRNHADAADWEFLGHQGPESKDQNIDCALTPSGKGEQP